MKLNGFSEKFNIKPRQKQDQELWKKNLDAELLTWAIFRANSNIKHIEYAIIFKNKHGHVVGFINGYRRKIVEVLDFIKTTEVQKVYSAKIDRRLRLIENI